MLAVTGNNYRAIVTRSQLSHNHNSCDVSMMLCSTCGMNVSSDTCVRFITFDETCPVAVVTSNVLNNTTFKYLHNVHHTCVKSLTIPHLI